MVDRDCFDMDSLHDALVGNGTGVLTYGSYSELPVFLSLTSIVTVFDLMVVFLRSGVRNCISVLETLVSPGSPRAGKRPITPPGLSLDYLRKHLSRSHDNCPRRYLCRHGIAGSRRCRIPRLEKYPIMLQPRRAIHPGHLPCESRDGKDWNKTRQNPAEEIPHDAHAPIYASPSLPALES